MNNRRSRIVINGRFQYQYALLAASASVLLVNLFIIIDALLPGSQGFSLSTKHTYYIAALEVLLILGVWWGSLLSSHKIAGPVYVIVRQMEKLAEGDLTARVKLRKNDMFRFEAVAINQCIEELQAHLSEVKNIAQALADTNGEHDENSRALVTQLNQKIASLTL